MAKIHIFCELYYQFVFFAVFHSVFLLCFVPCFCGISLGVLTAEGNILWNEFRHCLDGMFSESIGILESTFPLEIG